MCINSVRKYEERPNGIHRLIAAVELTTGDLLNQGVDLIVSF